MLTSTSPIGGTSYSDSYRLFKLPYTMSPSWQSTSSPDVEPRENRPDVEPRENRVDVEPRENRVDVEPRENRVDVEPRE